MPNGQSQRTEGYPRLTARTHWGRYAAGMATEAAFILALTAVGLAVALLASVVYR